METSIFEQGNHRRTYFMLTIPNVCSMVVTLLYNIADTFFIAQTQNALLVAGVSLCAPVFTILMALGNVYAQGGISLMSRLLGRKDYDNIHKVSSFCFYFALLSGIIAAALLLIFRVPMLNLLGASENTITYATPYYCIISAGAPLIVLSFIHSNQLRAEGLAKASMCGTITGAVVNVVLDPILISFCGLGAIGAATASLLGYTCSILFFLFIVKKKSQHICINPKKAMVNRHQISQIYGIGIAAALTNVMSSICQILTNQFLLPYGDEQIAAMGIAIRISDIIYLVLVGLAYGGQPLVGYLMGAKRQKDLQKLLKFIILFLSAVAVGMTVILAIIAVPLTGCFLHDAEIVSAGALMLRLRIITMVLAGIYLVISLLFQSAGKAKGALILSIARQGFIFVPIIVIASQAAGYYGILSAQAIADVLSFLLALIMYCKVFRGKPDSTSADTQ